MIFLDDANIPTAMPDDLRQARKDAHTLMLRLRGAYICGLITRHYSPTAGRSILDLFGDMPVGVPLFEEVLGDAIEALIEPYDETTESKIERAYNHAVHQRELCTAELIRRREPLDLESLGSRFIF
jgi:hypothetical protein